jgi:uncharacterized glyoxalase superfamily protein PhnB
MKGILENKMDNPKSQPQIPEGYGSVTPWIISKDSMGLISFLKKAFNAKSKGEPIHNPDGSVGHAEIIIGNSVLMLFDSKEDWPTTRTFLRLFFNNPEKMYQQALDAGAQSVTEITELFWGDRVGRVCDPFGNIWWIQSLPANLPYEEIQRRSKDPDMIKAMEYVQRSLDEALSNDK